MTDDRLLDRLLDENGLEIPQQRLWAVRRAILLYASGHPVRRHFIFGFHPAFALATALFGLVLGFSMPQIVQSDHTSALLDITTQPLDEETFG